jgi:glyoxylase-like metal-dependent hydrolase (beta-lactamase superfamily II)
MIPKWHRPRRARRPAYVQPDETGFRWRVAHCPGIAADMTCTREHDPGVLYTHDSPAARPWPAYVQPDETGFRWRVDHCPGIAADMTCTREHAPGVLYTHDSPAARPWPRPRPVIQVPPGQHMGGRP